MTIDIKLGGDMLIEAGAKSLRTLSEKIDTQKMKSPAFLMVHTATGDYPYHREDCVCIVPIDCLGV